MLRTSAFLAAAFCMLARTAQAATNLTLDYSGKKQWVYAIVYSAQCVSEDAKGSSTKKTNIQGTLNADVSENKDKMAVAVKDLMVSSDLYDEAEMKRLSEQISSAKYSLALVDGYPVVDTSVDFAAEGLPEWNLYLHLARLVPEMSEKPVKKGFSWERTVTLPVPTAHGTVDCEVYRVFRVDAISKEKDKAHISWQFRYAATGARKPSVSQLKYAPVAGNGGGKAEIDIANKCIIHAEMQFETPVATVDNVRVSWKEQASIELKPAK
jgi:hypothetical protein